MTAVDVVTLIFLFGGGFFFLAGTVGLLRFPDSLTRLHALTKADNLGLGLVVFGLALQADSWLVAGKQLMIWGLVLFAGANVAHLIASRILQRGSRPWKR